MDDRDRQLLPWLPAGRFAPEEAARLEAALAGDDEAAELLRCARLLKRAAREDPHTLSSRLLLEYADGSVELDDEARQWIETALKEDSLAAEAVAKVRSLSEPVTPVEPIEPGSPGDQRGAGRTWQWLAAAALVVAAVGIAGWVATWRTLAVARSAQATPEINVPIAELLPRELVLRGEETPAVPIPPGARRATLLLTALEGSDGGPYQVELSDPTGKLLWRETGLRRLSPGWFVIVLPVSGLSPGTHTLRVSEPGTDDFVGSYRFEIFATP